ncbi:(d)CMP kinase [Gammaproteobacteria bacterium LSUCC0112]|nr:(d)CMP kinase [Gammaproteobacteria bacterium LSUCC0112]
MATHIPVLAIDGPGGAGKGTISRLAASRLGWHYLDSGALYRILAYAGSLQGVDLQDENALSQLAGKLDIRFGIGSDEGVWLDGEEISDQIRTEQAGAAASRVAALPLVREALLQQQKAFRRSPGLVADGRDMGTVVFPDATVKVFLTASVEERAQRRYNQLIAKGIDGKLCDLLADIQARDERDSNRSVAPLRPAADAVLIDTSQMGINEVLITVLNLINLQTP